MEGWKHGPGWGEGCRRSGMAPLRDAASVRGEPARPPASARRATVAGLSSPRSPLSPDPLQKKDVEGRGSEERLLPPLPKSVFALSGMLEWEKGTGAPRRFLGNRSGCWVSLEGFGWWSGGLLRKGDCLPLIFNYKGLKIVLEGQSVLQLLGRNNC